MEFAKIHAANGDNLVLVARSLDKLNALKRELESKFGIEALVISKDLSELNAAQEVYDTLLEKRIQVEYLINNAGFGDFGMFYETDWQKEAQMINLNITALTHFTKLFIRDMVSRKSGKVMNVASTAAFQPGPTMAVYFATKAYVLHFSEAVNNEVRDNGVTVTALCPGPTESGFQSAASMDDSKLFKNKKVPTSAEVAAYGYRAMHQGKSVAIHGFMNAIMARSVGLVPRNLIVKIARKMQE
jgi:short-subunit dehydrogenase